MNAAAVMLIVTIVTGPDKPDVTHRVPMPDLQVCLKEAEEFLDQMKIPDGAQGLAAACFVPKKYEIPS